MNCFICHLSLGLEPPHYGKHLVCFEALFGVKGRATFHSLARQSVVSGDEVRVISENPHLTSYFSGHYRKYEARLEGASYLLKMSKDDYPELAPVEELCNRIAERCGIGVPKPHGLIDFEGEPAFVSRNFMSDRTAHSSLQHIYHFLKPGPEHYNVEEISKAIFQETHSVEDVEMFLRALLFDALVGNHDRHGRNLALVITARKRRLAPVYDNPSAIGLASGSLLRARFAPKGKIWTRDSREPEMKEYVEELLRLGKGNVVETFHAQIDPDALAQMISSFAPLTPGMRNAMTKLIMVCYEALHEYVKTK